MKYEWDPEKAESNKRKHGVSFENATCAFDDPSALDKRDNTHSEDEPRYNIIGQTKYGLIFVVYTEREQDVIRIISARKATKHEEQEYFE